MLVLFLCYNMFVMENSHKYFENRECKYYPCHKTDEINCLFCYCPLYSMEHCPGLNHFIEKDGRKVKVCTDCEFPHKAENYETIIGILKNKQS